MKAGAVELVSDWVGVGVGVEVTVVSIVASVAFTLVLLLEITFGFGVDVSEGLKNGSSASFSAVVFAVDDAVGNPSSVATSCQTLT